MTVGQEPLGEIASDEPGAAGDEDVHVTVGRYRRE
jgi:hypothetical protein